MKRKFFSLLILAAIVNHAFAQDEFDALRYSYNQLQGTARSQSLGGAVGSIGADFSALSVNPAGIGIYKSSEFTFSPSFSVGSNESSYLGGSISRNSSKLNISNAGIIITNTQPGGRNGRKNGWKAFNFGIGMNRLANYKNEYAYSGENRKNSFIEVFSEDFNSLGGINNNSLSEVNFGAYGAYQTYLIDTLTGSSEAISFVPYADGIRQTKTVQESGGLNEYVISFGGNYLDQLMIGATIGIQSVRYDRNLQFQEEDISGNNNNDFNYFNFRENLNTTGAGVNLKIGAIYKPNPAFRLGLALHTPTFTELNDVSAIEITSHTDSLLLGGNPGQSPISTYTQDSAQVFNYSLQTPYKALLSAVVFIGTKGFITSDIEYVDYASMRYDYGLGYDNETNKINSVIQNTYQDAINVRLGAEARLSSTISIRGGFAYYGSPYKSNAVYGSRSNGSLGIGYRNRFVFMDAAYSLGFQKYVEYPYLLSRNNASVQASTIATRRGALAVTFGFRF